MAKEKAFRAMDSLVLSEEMDLDRLVASSEFWPREVFFIRGEYKFIKCPDGEPVLVLKDPRKAFPKFASDWDVTMKAVLKGLGEIEATAEAGVKKKIKSLYGKLDVINADVNDGYYTNYLEFTTRPCDPKSADRLRNANDTVRRAAALLRILQLQVSSDDCTPESLEALVGKLVDLVSQIEKA